MRRGKGGPLSVVEYSELDQSLSSAINQETGRLRFCWSNVLSILPCIFDFSFLFTSFLIIVYHPSYSCTESEVIPPIIL